MLYEGQEYDAETLATRLMGELKAAKPSKELLDQIGANPKTRTSLLRLMKTVKPDLPIPEIDAAEPVLEAVNAISKRLDDKEKAEAEEKAKAEKESTERSAKADIDKGRSLLRKRGYQDEGIEKVESLMTERGIPDYEAAEALFAKSNHKDTPIIPTNLNRSWDLFAPPEDNNDIKSALGLPRGPAQHRALKAWQGKELNNVLKEIRGIA